MEEAPFQRTMKIGRASVGLIGLDQALAEVIGLALPEKEAADLLFEKISKQNYVPEGGDQLYRDALLREYRRRRGEAVSAEEGLVIRVLGPGCVSCNRLKTLLIEVLSNMRLAADIEDVHELDEIWRYGVLNTPALVVNGRVLCEGRLPTRAEVEEWLRREVE